MSSLTFITPALYVKPSPATVSAKPKVTLNAPEFAELEPASTSKPSPAPTVTDEISPEPSNVIQ